SQPNCPLSAPRTAPGLYHTLHPFAGPYTNLNLGLPPLCHGSTARGGHQVEVHLTVLLVPPDLLEMPVLRPPQHLLHPVCSLPIPPLRPAALSSPPCLLQP
ncbi:unnamed protein product, partial [Pylaiella littoralis]